MLPIQNEKWSALRFQVEVLPEQIPRTVPAGDLLFVRPRLVAECLQVATDSLLQGDGSLKGGAIGKPGVPIDGPHTLAQSKLHWRAGPQPHVVPGDRQRAAKRGHAVAPFLSGGRQTITAIRHLLTKPEPAARISVVKL